MMDILVWTANRNVIVVTELALKLQGYVQQKVVSEDGRAIRAVKVSYICQYYSK
jgi:hypothetical protein